LADLLCFIYKNIAKAAEAVYSNVVGAIGDSLAIFALLEEKGWRISAPNYPAKVAKTLEFCKRIHSTFSHVLKSYSI
jgi:hypothetical protein